MFTCLNRSNFLSPDLLDASVELTQCRRAVVGPVSLISPGMSTVDPI